MLNSPILAPQLAADTLPVAESDFAWLRYLNDQRFPWLVLVPKQPGLREWYELDANDQQHLLAISNSLSQTLQQLTGATKMNLGALGNLVPQLHLHLIARNPTDACWPGPVWGQGEAIAYTTEPDWLTPLQQHLTKDTRFYD